MRLGGADRQRARINGRSCGKVTLVEPGRRLSTCRKPRALARLREHHVGVVLSGRAGWLARPWFFASVATLALNDHVLKAAWPGLMSGKLSDIAGLVVVGTVASVLVGRSWGAALTGIAFASLKLIPGVAEAAAPALGGGVTLRDPTDLVALAALPLLWRALGHDQVRHPVGNDRLRQAAGLLLAVLATTATTPPPPSDVRDIGFSEGVLYARVYLEEDTRNVWLRSPDRGVTWTATDDPGEMREAAYKTIVPLPRAAARENVLEQCAADGVCWRVRTHDTRADQGREHLVERCDPGSDWTLDYRTSLAPSDLAVDLRDSTKVAVTDGMSVFVQQVDGQWNEVALILVAANVS